MTKNNHSPKPEEQSPKTTSSKPSEQLKSAPPVDKKPAQSAEKTSAAPKPAASKPVEPQPAKLQPEKLTSKKPNTDQSTTKAPENSTAKSTVKPAAKPPAKPGVKLNGLFAFKLGMSSIYDEKGRWTAVTLLKFRPWHVSQVKTVKKEGYTSIQLACTAQKNKRCSRALVRHLSPAGFKEGALHVREIRQKEVEGISPGQVLSIHSLQKGDVVSLSSVSKGHGFAGVVKRWGFKGGPASHGAKTHRTSGSIGNRTEPGRVQPGKKMAGRYGGEHTTLRSVKLLDVLENQNLLVVKGSVPGARNSLVYLRKAATAKSTSAKAVSA